MATDPMGSHERYRRELVKQLTDDELVITLAKNLRRGERDETWFEDRLAILELDRRRRRRGRGLPT